VTWLKASEVRVGRPYPFHLYLVICLQQRKSTENLSQDSQVVLDTNHCINLSAFLLSSAGLISIIPPLLSVGDFRQALVGTGAI
jgi:hypothetical protein